MDNVLKLVQLINALLGTASALGISWSSLAGRIAAVEAEGREFGLEDLAEEVAEARAALDALNAAIEAASQPES